MTSIYTSMVMVQKILNTYTLQVYLIQHKQLIAKTK
nr:MAG TPA: hypothetical protein [Bacteriophage sp.]DAH14118.1 MAG TPA: hypothetical protein [Caudoviricetes sp.]